MVIKCRISPLLSLHCPCYRPSWKTTTTSSGTGLSCLLTSLFHRAIICWDRHNYPYSTKAETELSEGKQVTQLTGILAGTQSPMWQMPKFMLVIARHLTPWDSLSIYFSGLWLGLCSNIMFSTQTSSSISFLLLEYVFLSNVCIMVTFSTITTITSHTVLN